MVNTGPSEPMSEVRLAPMRLIASAMKKVGNTVENSAMATDRTWMDDGAASASMGRVARNCANTNAEEINIAQAMKRKLPSRTMIGPQPIRYNA